MGLRIQVRIIKPTIGAIRSKLDTYGFEYIAFLLAY